jgi:hypothetical protein
LAAVQVDFYGKMAQQRHRRFHTEYPRLTDISIVSRETRQHGLDLDRLLLKRMRSKPRPVLVCLFINKKSWMPLDLRPDRKAEQIMLYEFHLDDKTRGRKKTLQNIGELRTFDLENGMTNYIVVNINRDLVLISDREKVYTYNVNSWERVRTDTFEHPGVYCTHAAAVMLPCGDLVLVQNTHGELAALRAGAPDSLTNIIVLDPITMLKKHSFVENTVFHHARMFHTARHEGFLLFAGSSIAIYQRNQNHGCGYSRHLFQTKIPGVIHDCLLIDQRHIVVCLDGLPQMFDIETPECIGAFLPSGKFQTDKDSHRTIPNSFPCNIRCLSSGYALIWNTEHFSIWNLTTCIWAHAASDSIHTIKEMPDNKLLVCTYRKYIVMDINKRTPLDEFDPPLLHQSELGCQTFVLARLA